VLYRSLKWGILAPLPLLDFIIKFNHYLPLSQSYQMINSFYRPLLWLILLTHVPTPQHAHVFSCSKAAQLYNDTQTRKSITYPDRQPLPNPFITVHFAVSGLSNVIISILFFAT
jgi:hypothetical protein